MTPDIIFLPPNFSCPNDIKQLKFSYHTFLVILFFFYTKQTYSLSDYLRNNADIFSTWTWLPVQIIFWVPIFSLSITLDFHKSPLA